MRLHILTKRCGLQCSSVSGQQRNRENACNEWQQSHFVYLVTLSTLNSERHGSGGGGERLASRRKNAPRPLRCNRWFIQFGNKVPIQVDVTRFKWLWLLYQFFFLRRRRRYLDCFRFLNHRINAVIHQSRLTPSRRRNRIRRHNQDPTPRPSVSTQQRCRSSNTTPPTAKSVTEGSRQLRLSGGRKKARCANARRSWLARMPTPPSPQGCVLLTCPEERSAIHCQTLHKLNQQRAD
ncbi:hypothetical protein Pla52n_60270 [Stieleria varia]|uniref:Uncharacterized protein n=1 Tax=Stieleria varia TaxID=2528005 RepID=A0A5C5ZYC0_9BACT|nr:hypothetical protein Pla52n_60270 [Stieleria varia]